MSNCRYTPECDIPGPGIECAECGEECVSEELYEVGNELICEDCILCFEDEYDDGE